MFKILFIKSIPIVKWHNYYQIFRYFIITLFPHVVIKFPLGGNLPCLRITDVVTKLVTTDRKNSATNNFSSIFVDRKSFNRGRKHIIVKSIRLSFRLESKTTVIMQNTYTNNEQPGDSQSVTNQKKTFGPREGNRSWSK